MYVKPGDFKIVFSIILFSFIFFRLVYIDIQKRIAIRRRVLFIQVNEGPGASVLLLHGILGSHRYWTKLIILLQKEFRIFAPDLLGFGDSPKPYLKYTVDDHLGYIERTIDPLMIIDTKIIIIGHSMGAILALNYAIKNPQKVKALVLINPPFSESEDDLQKSMENSSANLISAMTFNLYWGYMICKIHEIMPRLPYPLIRWAEPDLPAPVAWDTTKHSWESITGSLKNVLQKQNIFKLLPQVKELPLLLITSENDIYSTAENLQRLKDIASIEVQIFKGDHNFLLLNPEDPAAVIQNFLHRIKAN